MKRLINYVPMHILVLVILGIIVQFYTRIWSFGFTLLFIVFFFFLILIKAFKHKISTTILSFGSFFLIGIAIVYIQNDKNYTTYYQHHLKEKSAVIFTVKKVLKPSFYYHKYYVEVTQVDTTKTRGKILLNINKDTLLLPLQVDEQIYLKPTFLAIKSISNPQQFNYKAYLEKQGIFQQVFNVKNQFLKKENKSFSLVGFSSKFRNKIKASLEKHAFKKDELAVINALLLGQRQDVSKELTTEYQKAGAIHILAVSGLHVGIILLLLSFIFKPLERLKYGLFIKTVCIVLLLWMFAFIAGLSASVVRAVTMFTFLAVGQAFKRKNIVAFSLITSMFFLLIVKPTFLFDVGFQLSYLAVFGIIWVQPKLVKVWQPKLKVVHFFWQLFTVSIAAQIGILPLSIYYFQQFPGLFLLSNVVIIPFLGTILICGISVIILSLLNFLPAFAVTIYGTVISWMNSFVGWISNQEAFLFKEISISFLIIILWYVLTVFGIRCFFDKTPKKIMYFLMIILSTQSLFLVEIHQKKNKKELLVFHKMKHTIIGKRVGEKLYLQHSLDSLNFKDDYSLKPYRIVEGIKEIHQTNFKNFIKYSDKNILLIDSLGVYKMNALKLPIVVLQYSPKINLERLIKSIKPLQIIADGSNYKSDIAHWKIICNKQKIPFHSTSEKGAFKF